MSPHKPTTLADLKVPAAIVIGAIWGLSFVIGAVTASWVALGVTTPVVSIVAMAIFSIRNGNGRNGKGPDVPPS